MSTEPWYVEFFGEDYLRIHEPYLTPERTEQETIGILQLLNLAEGSKILDLACGHGRHTIPLAAVGYRMTGLDLSEVFLDRARETATRLGVDLRLVRGDMRSIPFSGEFDAVINIFNTFGYLESEEDDLEVLRQVAHALAPGGLFLLETINRDGLVRNFLPADVDRHEDGLLVIQEQAFDPLTSRLEVRITMLEPGGTQKEYHQSVRFYTLTELAAMLQAAGLELESYYGGLDGSGLTLNALRLVVLARKNS